MKKCGLKGWGGVTMSLDATTWVHQCLQKQRFKMAFETWAQLSVWERTQTKKFQVMQSNNVQMNWPKELTILTRMHSSRMHTTRSLTIRWGWGGGHVSAQGGTCPGGEPAQGGEPAWGYLPRGVYLPREDIPARGCTCLGGVPAWGCTCPGGWGVYLLRYSPLWTEWQTGAKILPCPRLRLRAVITLKTEVPAKLTKASSVLMTRWPP